MDEKCDCNLVNDLACPSQDFEQGVRGGHFLTQTDCMTLKKDLINATNCYSNRNLVKYDSVCNKTLLVTENGANKAIIAIMSLAVVIVLIVCATKIYQWYLKKRKVDKLMDKWKTAFPATTVYR